MKENSPEIVILKKAKEYFIYKVSESVNKQMGLSLRDGKKIV